ncbi:MAG: hypothetical protein WCP46_00625 [Alphaproteobacteria bacterium]
MSDYSLTTLFVVPVGNSLPTTGGPQDLAAGQFGIFLDTYAVANAGNIAAAPYFYLAQGRTNTYLQGSKRSDKISAAGVINWYKSSGSSAVATTQATTTTGVTSGSASVTLGASNSNIVVGQIVTGTGIPAGTIVSAISGTALTLSQNATASAGGVAVTLTFAGTEIVQLSSFSVQPGEDVSLTLRAHSSYIDTLYFNGFTRSVTVAAACLDCGGDPCTDLDAQAFVDSLIVALNAGAPGINPDNISLAKFFYFNRVGTGSSSKLIITAKPLTAYGQPCDVAAFPYEYDRLWFRAFIYAGPATTADFIVADNCNLVATVAYLQRSFYPQGTSDQVKQLEKNLYSYQAGYLKHLYRMAGFNENFESWVTDGTVYDIFYVKYKPYGINYAWGEYIQEDAMDIIAVPTAISSGVQTVLAAALGTPPSYSGSVPPINSSPIIP